MAREYYTDINLKGNRLTNALLTVEESDTTTALYPEVGRIIIDDGVLKYHDGSVWKTVGEGTGGGGGGTLSYPYRWKTSTTATDPTHGGIKGNASDAALITEMYASAYDQNGVAVLGLLDVTTGSDIVVYEAGSGSTWNRYVLTAPPIPQGTPTEWVTLPVVYAETGALAFTPGNNTAVLLSISLPSLPEVDEVYVGPTPPTNPFDGQMWVNLTGPGGPGGGGGGTAEMNMEHVDPTNTTAYGLLINDNNNVSAVPLTELVRPVPPTGLSVQVGLTFVRLTWAAVSGASSYTVYRNGNFLLTTTATSYRDNSIVVNTLYTYTIRSANRFGMRGSLSAGINAYPDSANNSVPTIGIVAWPATNAPGQKQVIRVTASDLDAQDLATLLNVNVGALEATKDPAVWLLTL